MIQPEITKSDNITEVLISDCPICFRPIELIELPCSHKICNDCRKNIHPDKDGNKNCPFCRESYDKIQSNSETITEQRRIISTPIYPKNQAIVYVNREEDPVDSKFTSWISCICISTSLFCCLFGHAH